MPMSAFLQRKTTLWFALSGLLLASFSAIAQSAPATLSGFQATAPLTGLTHTASGIELSDAASTLKIDAMRPDVLRVRVYPNGRPSEDASWAVLPEPRKARIAVTAEDAGFSTSQLRVAVDAELRIVVSDLAGNVLQRDAAPASWNGTGFKVSKQKTGDDQFLGRG